VADSGHHSRNGFLTDRGYAEVAQRAVDQFDLDVMAAKQYVDSRVSVSALLSPLIHWDDDLIDQQYRRFHNAS